MDEADLWRRDCEGNISFGVWFGKVDPFAGLETSEFDGARVAAVARAIWSYPDLAGPVATSASAAVDISRVGEMIGGASLDSGHQVGCSVVVCDVGSVWVHLPEDGFARVLPPWPWGSPKVGEQATILDAADRWMTRLTEHVQGLTEVPAQRDDEI